MGRVLDGLGETDLHAADGVDHVLEAVEVEHHVVVDAHVGELLELLDRASRPSDGECFVPHHVGGAGDGLAVLADAVGPVDEAVARDADAVREGAVGGEVEHDRGVGALAVAGEAVDVVALAVASVRPHDQQVDGLLRTVVHGELVRAVGQLLLHVDDVQVVVEVAVEVDAAQTEHEAERDDTGHDDGGRRTP